MPVKGIAYAEVDVICLLWHMYAAYIMIFEVLAVLSSYVVHVGSCLTDVSIQPVGSVFKGQAMLNFLTVEDETVGKR